MIYDVVICGGGLAGLTLARQLTIANPKISIMILEKRTFPLSEDHGKIGESTVELSSYYFGEILRLKDYFKNTHYKKLGFRFFLGDGQKEEFANRPEIGLSKFPSYDSFQIDRGIFENDLFQINTNNGINIIQGATIKDIELKDNDLDHVVIYKGSNGDSIHTIRTRWVVDASGRRRLLQRKLGLGVPSKEKHSAIWFRVKGRLDVDNFASPGDLDWNKRVPNKIRYYSTNHLLGHGYWVWLIPLPSGNTSVGVVTTEKIHPFEGYNTKKKVLKWLEEWEPVIFRHLKNYDWIDFGAMRNYSYGSKQIFSINRWACVGEAALFTDPFYSPGSNLIAYENCIVSRIIEKDQSNKLIEEEVGQFNDFIISTNNYLTEAIQSSYFYFDKSLVKALSFLWDILAGWTFGTPSMLNGIFLDSTKKNVLKKESTKYFHLISSMELFFQQWGKLSQNRISFKFLDYLSIPFVKQVYDRNIQSGKTTEELVRDQVENLNFLEQFAQVVFFIALEDALPGHLSKFKRPYWVNSWAISLSPEKWNSDGLFKPSTKPGNLSPMLRQLRNIFQTQEHKEKKEVEKLISISLNI